MNKRIKGVGDMIADMHYGGLRGHADLSYPDSPFEIRHPITFRTGDDSNDMAFIAWLNSRIPKGVYINKMLMIVGDQDGEGLVARGIPLRWTQSWLLRGPRARLSRAGILNIPTTK